MDRGGSVAFVIKDNGDNKEKTTLVKDTWVDVLKEIWKWTKKLFNTLTKIGKWFAKFFIGLSRTMWEWMDKTYGNKMGG